MNILISNDDGIDYSGLKELVKAFSALGNVYVCAPKTERSSNSHHFTLNAFMEVEERKIDYATKAYSVDGTPCDCIRSALFCLFKDIGMDLVVSGINKGWNMLSDSIYSGTVACAREGFMQSIPSIALSVDSYCPSNFSYAGKIGVRFAQKYLSDPKRAEYYLSINIPDLPEKEIRGIAICPGYGLVDYDENYIIEQHQGKNYIKGCGSNYNLNFDREDMSIDVNALKAGFVTVSPLYTQYVNKTVCEHIADIFKQ